MGRFGSGDERTDAALFLASDDSSYTLALELVVLRYSGIPLSHPIRRRMAEEGSEGRRDRTAGSVSVRWVGVGGTLGRVFEVLLQPL